MLLITSLLMIIANNISILASYRWVWAPIFLLFTIFFYSKVFSQKNVRSALLYGFFFAGILQYSLWMYASDWYKKAVFEDFYAMVIIVILFAILARNKYFKEWGKLANLGLLFLIFTGIMTIVATSKNPEVVRASYSGGQYKMPGYESLFRLGFGSYSYIAAVVAFLPILVYYIKENSSFWISKKIAIFLILFFLIVIVRAQIFANVVVAAVCLIIALLGAKNFKKNIIIFGVLYFLIANIPIKFWTNELYKLSEYFESGTTLNYKFRDFALYLQNPELVENASTGTSRRAARYPMLLKVFLASPFLGDASYRSNYVHELAHGGHLYWMSHLALWGIFGFVGYIFVLKNIFQPVFNMICPELKFYYQISLLSLIILGLIKNIGGREPYIMLLIIIPGLCLSKDSSK